MYFSNGKIQLKHTLAARKYFRENSERAFAGHLRLWCFALPSDCSGGCSPAGSRVHREASGCTLSWKGWLDEARKRSFSVQPPHVQKPGLHEHESLNCVDSTRGYLHSHQHSGEQDPALTASSRDTPRNTKQKSPSDRCW